jgi:polyisoprenoid-binding protein YceI
VAIPAGTYRLGPDSGSLEVRTYREGFASKVGHDLVIDVTAWEATVSVADDPAEAAIELRADPRSLQVREGLRGVKPLTKGDRDDIRATIEDQVLGSEPIVFVARGVELADGALVEGDLTMAGATRPTSARLAVTPDGRVSSTVALTQSDWGIKPYRGLMGALKVRDAVDVVVEARLPPADH